MGRLIRSVSEDLSVRLFVIDGTSIVQKAQEIHNTYPVASAALGRSLCAASIMGSMMKGERDSLTFQIKGDGPLGTILCVSDTSGNVKGYVDNPACNLPSRESDGKLDVAKAVGKNGSLSIVRDLGLKEPYRGVYPLQTGEIAEDLTAYFFHSEQQPSAVALGVLVNPDGSIGAAGGYLLQMMPEASEETICGIEQNLAIMPPISQFLAEGNLVEEVAEFLLLGYKPQILESREVEFACDCSEERMSRALLSIGAKDLQEILETDTQAELQCHFCNTKYLFDKNALEDLLRKASK